jgi:hypothetical protein
MAARPDMSFLVCASLHPGYGSLPLQLRAEQRATKSSNAHFTQTICYSNNLPKWNQKARNAAPTHSFLEGQSKRFCNRRVTASQAHTVFGGAASG